MVYLAMTKLANKEYPQGRLAQLDFFEYQGCALLPQSRELSFQRAVNGDFTHWLSLDDDMMFQHNIVDRFIASDKDIICANYRKKTFDRVEGVALDFAQQPIDSSVKTGLEIISKFPMGCTLFKMARIRDIPAPHFEIVFNKDTKTYQGEDLYFSDLCNKEGVEIYCDHDISKDVIHIGDYPYKWGV